MKRLEHALGHLTGLGVRQELLAQPEVRLVGRDAQEEQARSGDELPAGGPLQDARGRLLGLGGRVAAGAAQHADREDRERGIGDAAADGADPVELAVLAVLRRVADEGLREPPQRVAGEADRGQHEQRVPERLVRDLLHRALLVGLRRGHAVGEADGQHADQGVDDAARDVSGAGERLEQRRLGEGFGVSLGDVGIHGA